jgi:2'-5' RNA ligase
LILYGNAVAEVSGRAPSFVMTLKLDDASFTQLQEWRTRYFPAKLNLIPAHLTLLHKVSDEQVSRLRAAWHDFEPLAPVPLHFAAPRLLGNGVAIGVDSVELQRLRARLLMVMAGILTRQDQQPFTPHVTIQNKVGSGEAKALYESMGAHFAGWHGEGRAVLIWQYLGGPWQLECQLTFNGIRRIGPPSFA